MAHHRWENTMPATMAGTGIDIASLLKANNISPRVQQHLLKVFSMLAATMVASCFGTVFYLYTHFSPFLATLVTSILMFGLVLERRDYPTDRKIPRLLMYGFFQGVTMGSLVELALAVSPYTVLQAFSLTVLMFGCFAGAAMLTERRSLLYLYGALASGMSWLMFASFVNIFVGSSALLGVEVYLGLAFLLGYVCADTQLIIEKADIGDEDFVRHSLDLFMDFAGIFIRILIIILRSREESEARESRKKRRE
jgi:FtsH-binding integral membrane protein